MKKILLTAVLLAAIGAAQAQHSYREDQGVYNDDRGQYHWQVVERKVWIPEQRVRGILGWRTVPGHYETRTERQKIYHYDQDSKGRKRHPHGMPPGQRKKLSSRYSDNYPYGNNRNDTNDRYNKRRD